MIQLHNLKQFMLNKVKEAWNAYPIGEKELYCNISEEVEQIDLARILGHIRGYQKFYFKNREQNKEYLGIEILESFSGHSCLKKIEDLTLNHPELLLMGTLPFHSAEEVSEEWQALSKGHFFLPLILFKKINEKFFITITLEKKTFHDELLQMQTLLRIEKALTFVFNKENTPQCLSSTLAPNREQWKKIVDHALTNILNKEFDKVVLARKKILSFGQNIHAPSLFASFNKSHINSYALFYQIHPDTALLSFSPEKLFSIENNTLELDSLAGTTLRSTDPKTDRDYEKQLLNCEKNRTEHLFVTLEIKSILEKLDLDYHCDNRPKIVKLKHIQHLHTIITAKLNRPIPVSTLISSFHPTPAVGGMPTKSATKFIRDFENLKRGSYAAPFGVISKNYTELAVAIRSALSYKNQLHIYAGTGIVKGSSAEDEWYESENKMKNFEISNEVSEKRRPQPHMVQTHHP